MKAFALIVFLLLAVAGGAWHYLLEHEKTLQQEIAARKQKSRENQAKHEAKAAEALKAAFSASNQIVKAWAQKAKDEADAQDMAAQEAEEKRMTAEAEAKKAAENADAQLAAAEAAEQERLKAEALQAAEEAKRAAEQAKLAFVQTTNATRLAELATAEENRARAALEVRNRELAVKQLELAKADYEQRLRDVAELEELLRQREEETRPELTVADLMTTDDEMPEILGTVITNKPSAEPALLSGAAALLAAAEARRNGSASNLVARARGKATAKLEALVREAAKAGDEARAAYFLRQLKILYPDYEPKKEDEKK